MVRFDWVLNAARDTAERAKMNYRISTNKGSGRCGWILHGTLNKSKVEPVEVVAESRREVVKNTDLMAGAQCNLR